MRPIRAVRWHPFQGNGYSETMPNPEKARFLGGDAVSTRSLTLDLHPIFNKGREIDEALENAVQEARQKKAKELEIICGKGTGQLKKRVLRFLDRKDIRRTYHRIDKDKDNSGRIFVYFRWKRGQ